MKTIRTLTTDEFYIGYLPVAPGRTASLVKWFVAALAAAMFIICITLVLNQRRFSDGVFEYGKVTEVYGVLSLEPVPNLILNKDHPQRLLLLVGFGKMGADETIRSLQVRLGRPIVGAYVNLKGTKIYNEGKGLLQITVEDNLNMRIKPAPYSIPEATALGKISITGEIVDPKCYFGVMKPGEGKPHRSCAIRCISGGIPPVIKVYAKKTEYYVLAGNSINQAILPFVGEPVTLEGNILEYGDWNVLELDEKNIRTLVALRTAKEFLALDNLTMTQCIGENK